MKFDRRLLATVLAISMMLGMMRFAFAAELTAEYGPASYSDIAASTYSRMLLYRKGNGVVAAANESGLYGLVDLTGRAITDFKYKGMYVLDGGLFKFFDGDYWGVIDSTGHVVLPAGYYSISCCTKTVAVVDCYNRETKFYTLDWQPTTSDAYWGGNGDWYDRARSGEFGAGTRSTPEWAGQYDSWTSHGNVYCVGKGGKYGAVDENGTVLVPLQYDRASDIGGLNPSGYISAVTGVIGNYTSDIYQNGSLVKTFQGKRVSTAAYYRDFSFTTDNTLFGMMTIDGNELLPAQFKQIHPDGNGNYYTYIEDGYTNYVGLYTYDGDCILPTTYYTLKLQENNKYLAATSYNAYGLIDVTGTTVTTIIPLEYGYPQIHNYNFAVFTKNKENIIFTLDGDPWFPDAEEGSGTSLFASKLYNDRYRDPYDYEGLNFNGWAKICEGYSETVMPFIIKTNATESGYATYYVDYKTGENKGYIPYRASNISEDGYFIYQDANGKYGVGGTNGLPEPYAPTPLENGVRYVPYSVALPPIDGSYSVVAEVLPGGLRLTQNGEICGVPMAAGKWEFIVSDGTAEKLYTLTIEANSNAAVLRPNDYEIIIPVGAPSSFDPNDFILDSYRNETLTINGPYPEFMRLLIDGQELRRDVDYEAHEGSTVITIYGQTFAQKGEGTHTVAAEFREGGTSEGSLKTASQNYTANIKSATPEIPSNPGFNDGYNFGGYYGGGSNSTPPSTKPSTPEPKPEPEPSPEPEPEPDEPTELPFTDVDESRWFYEDVKWVYQNHVMNGVTATTFAPYSNISQATLVTVLARIANVDLSSFEDIEDRTIASGRWFSAAAIWAKQSGLLPDYSTFTGEETISREQMAITLVKYLQSMGKDTIDPAQTVEFADASLMSDSGKRAFQVLYSQDIFRGIGGGQMDPAGFTTRAQLAALSRRLYAVLDDGQEQIAGT